MKSLVLRLLGTAALGVSSCWMTSCGRNTITEINTVVSDPNSNEDIKGRFVVSNVSFEQGIIRVQLDTSKSVGKIVNHCGTLSPCLCQFSWVEVKSNQGTPISIPRSVKMPVIGVQADSVTCYAPQVYESEVFDGTRIKVGLIKAKSNKSGAFVLSPYFYTKRGASNIGSFQDAQGNFFDNVLRYTCYQPIYKTLGIQSKLVIQTHPRTGETVQYPSASRFRLSPSDFSSQAYFYNFYIKNTHRGDFNAISDNFVCPLVETKAGGRPWPWDATFALSTESTVTFDLKVEAKRSPLGYAARVNLDGTCPKLNDSDGQIISTYRLRRYLGIYPPHYDAGGFPQGKSQAIDTIYVLDRPVIGPNPLQPYAMQGPKPCPFAYFDRKKTTTVSIPGYVASSDSAWINKNIDGIEFPNFDQDQVSCSAALPLLNQDRTTFGITTVHQSATSSHSFKHLFSRPMEAFLPHYEEDLAFQACAPQARPFFDAPLHFSRNRGTGNVAWCSEVYPTQNTNIASLDPAASGRISPFTSHAVKNSASKECQASTFSLPNSTQYPYPSGGYANHGSSTQWDHSKASQTCDRTVVAQEKAWPFFPLQAGSSAVEEVISADSSYECRITYDQNGLKTGVSSPKDGCCNPKSVAISTDNGSKSSAHLEPDVACGAPGY